MRIILLTILFTYLNQFSVIRTHSHSSEPLLLLVSFDGFRWDYLNNHNLTNFNSLKEDGAYSDYIINNFVTVTLPNFWSIVTGLYEETHGMIQNEMYDPVLNEDFSLSASDKKTVQNLDNFKWFAQNNITEPIWITNQKHSKSRLSAAEWIGSNLVIHGESIISVPYNQTRPFNDIIDEFIQLFTREEEPINFGAIYFNEPDHTGHMFGPYSKELAEKLLFCDSTLGYLIEQLKDHHLFDKINIIVTADHGMAQISEKNARFLDKYVDINLFNYYGTRSVWNLFVKNGKILNYS